MAKAQKRGNKEAKKPKSAEKGAKPGPKYMAASDLGQAMKSAATRLGQQKK
ncbi:hypothetical protein ACUN0C_05280 [Faunimonas sp. B44]|uniref:hypothetical protein n=1 Tax=Faunimonas sp. B44 TaxID=3461493 RepID=UPI004044EE3C